ncbi:Voltage-gated chloride channel family protein, partial [human gut metagenome]
VIMGLCGVLFCRMIFAFKRFFDWLKCSRFLKLALTFVAVAAIGFDSQLLLGGGNDLVGQLAFQSHGVLLLGGIVLGKIL